MYAFNFDLFVFLRMEDIIEEFRSHAVNFPNDVIKSANALVSFVCLNPLNKTFMKVSVHGKGRTVLFFSTSGCSNNLKKSGDVFQIQIIQNHLKQYVT